MEALKECRVNDYEEMVLEQRPLVDVRAPAEFSAGSIPDAVNLPLMDDEERHQVGLCYRQQGREAALALGKRLVSGAVREQRIGAWLTVLTESPDLVLYCSRGGMRSEIVQRWLYERTGRMVPRVEGGYKGFRNVLLTRLEPLSLAAAPVVLGGRTGSGKTILLNRLENSIDLEAIANHRGSSFGRFITGQPCQADFENALAAALIRHSRSGFNHLIVEDEGRHVGRCYLPLGLSDFFKTGTLVILETPLEERVQITFDEYVVASQKAYCKAFGESGTDLWQRMIGESGDRIARRLGGERLKKMKALLAEAMGEQQETGSLERHKEWVRLLIADYYDPMYDYQLGKDSRNVIFRGDFDSVWAFLESCD
ncbi:MAG: tRNA 2-selenouridine(34) synthase MnmH [Desulfobacterales bacterium]|nr:MAG: tRNA 2-selenouridine(34) synthase MnmH [Desulfobacterales bacterium]